MHENKTAAYENELDRKECGFINSLRVKRVNNDDKRILNCLGFTYYMWLVKFLSSLLTFDQMKGP